MLARLGQRLLAGLAVVLGVVTLTFVLLHLAPGDPIDIILGPMASTQQVAVQRRLLGLDRPLADRSTPPPRAAARDADACRHRWCGALRARRDARDVEPAVHRHGAGEGSDDEAGRGPPRAAQCADAGGDTPRAVPARALFR